MLKQVKQMHQDQVIRELLDPQPSTDGATGGKKRRKKKTNKGEAGV